MSSTHQMHVQVRNRLPTLVLTVDDQAISVREPNFLSDLDGDDMHVADQFLIFFGDFVVRRQNLSRDD